MKRVAAILMSGLFSSTALADSLGVAAIRLPPESYMSPALSLEAAQAAISACNNKNAPSTVIVFGVYSGVVQVALAAHGASGESFSEAVGKAAVVAEMGISSGEYAALNPRAPLNIKPDPYRLSGLSFPAINAAGALPIKRGNKIIAIISVASVADPATDELCARAGVNRIKEQL